MRILFIHNYYQQRGGEDAVFEEEVNLLRENGFVIQTITFTNTNFDGSFLGNVTGAFKSLYNTESAKRVERVIDEFEPDLVHIHNLFYTASPSIINTICKKHIPIIMTLHNYRLVCNSGMLSREDEIPCERCLKQTIPLAGIKYGCFRNSRVQSTQLTAITSLHKLTGIWKKVDKFIVLTDFSRQKILQSSLSLRSEQVIVKPNFINELGYVDTSKRQKFFLYIGRLHYEKGIQSLVKAAYLSSSPIEIIGDGPLRPIVEQAAKDLPHVRYHGFLPRQEGIEKMKECRAIIVPSIWYEGLPTTILEAFASGTPVICSNQENLNSIVNDNQTGILFNTGNPESIVSAMNKLTDEQCNKFSRAGFSLYQEKYQKAVVLNRLVKIYTNLKNEYKLTS